MLMSIKEACRYQNFLESNIRSLTFYINNVSNAVRIKELHLKSKSNSKVEDEEKDMTIERQFDCSVVDISYLIKQLIEEKLKLSLAIDDAKKNLKLNWMENGVNLTLDSAIEYAKKIRDLSNNLKSLVNLKSQKSNKVDRAYTFNAEGNQTSYIYDVEVETEIDFDRTVAVKLYKSLLDKADTLSSEIEKGMLTDSVNYEPLYSVHDSLNEIVEAYIASQSKE